jgi:hypothetical protein
MYLKHSDECVLFTPGLFGGIIILAIYAKRTIPDLLFRKKNVTPLTELPQYIGSWIEQILLEESPIRRTEPRMTFFRIDKNSSVRHPPTVRMSGHPGTIPCVFKDMLVNIEIIAPTRNMFTIEPSSIHLTILPLDSKIGFVI